ncbi:Cofactor-independent phosphoglycerate mutase [Planctomycetales bacterium 10988]|nr:Cofactor-independent phosphoglycerate mutase [Planctomycetales bacterium 10988]
MDMHDLTRELSLKNDSKIIMLVSDGIGGCALEPGGPTELEAANTPNLDTLAREGSCGLSIPVQPGITPGSGPGHLGLFGYDPLKYQIGRGALEATGIGFQLQPKDVAVRCNFCTVDDQGNITDRRAGRISTEEAAPLVEKLNNIKLDGAEVFVQPVKEYRFVLVLRAAGLGGSVADTDPQKTGVPPLDPKPLGERSNSTAVLAKQFFEKACEVLKGEPKANALTMRGFSPRPSLPTYEEVYKLKAGAIAVYPMYKGLASLVGMDLLGEAKTLSEQIDVLEQNWNDYDFFFIHFKYTDSTGEDGNFEAKAKRIEELDAIIPRIRSLDPTVLTVTGDHSTPALMKSHSWHPVPTLIHAPHARVDRCQSFGENEAAIGQLGTFEARFLMPMLLGHAGRLNKFGA